ncbi:MAG: permease [Bacteroidales bacterium]|nr:permease [Bacteroidales bacterium]MCF8458870.1 permease [Bacteroidales bacterium]
MQYIFKFWEALYDLTNEMAFWLLIGFLFAGILNVLISKSIIYKYLGKNNFRSILNATLLGIPLPLCSCGVIPTGVAFHKNGASKPASVSFLISTPQTGVDSIMVTYSLLGLPFAIIRPIVAFFTGLIGGLFAKRFTKHEAIEPPATNRNNEDSKQEGNVIKRILKYGLVEFLDDISKWLIIGLLIAAAIAVLVPDDFFTSYIQNDLLEMLIILVASIPLYVCATGSVPIAAVLLMKGISPGAALVFLMAGPATNAATMTVIGQAFGKKTLIAYLFAIIGGAILGGLFVNQLPLAWFLSPLVSHAGHAMHFIPHWLMLVSSAILTLLLLSSMYRKYIQPKLKRNNMETEMKDATGVTVLVSGMTCNHCKSNVEGAIRNIAGVESIEANLELQTVTIQGNHIDLAKVKAEVESIGYKYGGEKS